MNIHGDVKVWVLTPEQMAAYKPGMDLGTPHRIEEARRIMISPINREKHRRRIANGVKTRTKGRTLINEHLYKKDRAAGMSDQEIAEKYKIKLSTLRHYQSLWRKQKAK